MGWDVSSGSGAMRLCGLGQGRQPAWVLVSFSCIARGRGGNMLRAPSSSECPGTCALQSGKSQPSAPSAAPRGEGSLTTCTGQGRRGAAFLPEAPAGCHGQVLTQPGKGFTWFPWFPWPLAEPHCPSSVKYSERQKGSMPAPVVCDSVLFLKTHMETLGSQKSTQLLLLLFSF